MTRIPVFSYSGNLARYWRRKGDWRQARDPDETAYIPCRNVDTARGDLAEFLLQVDPKTTIFFDGDYRELVDIVEVRQAARAHGWRQRSAEFKQAIGLDPSPTESENPSHKSQPCPSTAPSLPKSWSSSWQPLPKTQGAGDRSTSPDASYPGSASTSSTDLPSAFFELIDLLGHSKALQKQTDLIQAYQTLRVPPTQNWGLIQQAYRDRSRTTHPDRGGNQSEFQAVQEAYEYLKQRYNPRRNSP